MSLAARRCSFARAVAALGAGCVMVHAGCAPGANLFWDTNDAVAGAGGAEPGGTWDATGPLWNTSSAGTLTTGPWISGSTGVFAAGNDAVGAYGVTLAAAPSVGALSFEEGLMTLSAAPGGSIGLTGTPVLHTYNTGQLVNGGFETGITLASGIAVDAPISGTAGFTRTSDTTTNTSTGVLTLTANNAALSGTVKINGGITRISNAAALGSGDVIFDSANTAAMHASGLQLLGGISVSNNAKITNGGNRRMMGQIASAAGINTWSGNITFQGTSNGEGSGLAALGANAGATLVVTGTITGLLNTASTAGAWWASVGAGTVSLRSVNTWAGTNRVINGVLDVQCDGALGGNSVAGDISTLTLLTSLTFGVENSKPAITFTAPASSPGGFAYNQQRTIRMTGYATGPGTLAQLHNMSGANTFAGNLTLGVQTDPNGRTIGAEAGSSLELTGKIYATGTSARTCVKSGGGEIIISGANTAADGVTSGSSQEFALTSGVLIVNEGQLTIRGGSGSLSGGMAIQVNPGATLSLDNRFGVSTSRTAGVSVNSATFKLIGNSLTSVSQPLNSISVGGDSSIDVTQPPSITGAAATLTLAGTLGAANPGNITKTGNGDLVINAPGGAYQPAIDARKTTILGGKMIVSPRPTGTPFNQQVKTVYVTELDLGPLGAETGTLDLNDNDLVVSYGTHATSFSYIRGLVFDGFSGALGITSSTSESTQILALFDDALVGATSWNGRSIDTNSVVGKYTYFGDMNIDGQVTGDDYTVVDANLGTNPVAGLEWLSGDANLDGIVTGDDYTVIDANLGLGAGNPLMSSALRAVPEPGMGTAFIALVAGRVRRTRKTH